jgi:hypothetical protein
MSTLSDLDTLSINTVRTLAMDAVQQANSGHPGTPPYREEVLPFRYREGCRRTRLYTGMGALCRFERPRDRHEDLRCVGSPEGTAEKFGFEPARVVAAAKQQLRRD